MNSFTSPITLSREKSSTKPREIVPSILYTAHIFSSASLWDLQGALRRFGRELVRGSFGLSCRTKVQELTLMERAKEFLRAKQEESINS